MNLLIYNLVTWFCVFRISPKVCIKILVLENRGAADITELFVARSGELTVNHDPEEKNKFG